MYHINVPYVGGSHCCTCSGACYHTGVPTYCLSHQPNYGQAWTWSGTTFELKDAAAEAECDHCYCMDTEVNHVKTGEGIPHKICCKCSDERASKFLEDK